MCQFVGTYYYECQHVRFELYLFCHSILYQLNRINTGKEHDGDLLPFDPDTPGCKPCTVMKGDVVDITKTLHVDPRSNVVSWVTDLSMSCPSCERL